MEQRPDNLLKAIFDHQHELALKYLPIEKANGLLQTDKIPVDIHSYEGQARLRDMSWRCVEEVTEALEALDNENEDHFLEELADAMHFLVEKHILSGLIDEGPDDFNDELEEMFSESRAAHGDKLINKTPLVHVYAVEFIKAVGASCNILKNRPWKQTPILVNPDRLQKLLIWEMRTFIDLCKISGFTAKTLYDAYMRKNKINQERQEGGY